MRLQICPQVDEIATRIEAFVDALPLEKLPDGLAPVSDKALGELQRKLRLHPQVVDLLKRGLRCATWSIGQEAFGGFEWGSPKTISKLFQDLQGQSQQEWEILRGAPLTCTEPYLVVEPGGSVWRYSPRNPIEQPLAPSLGQFLHDWLASGCFGSHDYDLYFNAIKVHMGANFP